MENGVQLERISILPNVNIFSSEHYTQLHGNITLKIVLTEIKANFVFKYLQVDKTQWGEFP